MSVGLSEEGLLARARAIAGRSFASLASAQGVSLPPDGTTRRAKGWTGRLVEDALGSTARNAAAPDFPELGIEVKTIPVDRTGRPRESTFVCRARLSELGNASWEHSVLRKKLARVLWIPIEADPSVPLRDRRTGSPLLWSPSAEEEQILREDWDHLADLVANGYADTITAHLGRVVQMRPKAANNRARTTAPDEHGVPTTASPRGFYLRRTFTQSLLARHYHLPPHGR